ncbi:hypothetical protein [Oryzifoliimicrobium ureilyticus]|uniref:hypothetical protein n=1 Tax=Oryzifoliimicrobium ureilyticus TaxID=3113724 RepID=UPI0030760AED
MVKQIANFIAERDLGLAAARLSGKGLLKPGDMLSQRIPERHAFVRVEIEAGRDIPRKFEWLDLTGRSSDLHHQIYKSRPDVGAIAAGQLTWCSWLSRIDLTMPSIFDEQVRHLGVEAKRVGMSSTHPGPIMGLSNGANAYCLDDLVLCFGMGMERLLLNIEILEKCAECYVLAESTGNPVKQIPWLIRFIANRRLMKDERQAAALHLRGERSVMKAGY